MNNNFGKKKFLRLATKVLVIIAGTFIMAIGNMAFLNPYNIVPGGFTGFAILLNKTFVPIPPGVLALILNVPLFLVALKIKGHKFVLNSLLGTVVYSVFIDLIPLLGINLDSITDNALLATIYGGMLMGVGYGIIIRQGGSTGGSDMLASILTYKKPTLTFGTVLLLVDAVVVTFSGIAFSIKGGGIEHGLPPALYALLVIILSSLLSDFVIEGKRRSKAYFIFCNDPKTMSDVIFKKLDRGVTALSAKGMYTNTDKQILFCVVLRNESVALRRIVFDTDPAAFITATNTSEVFGEGFEKHDLPAEPKKKTAKKITSTYKTAPTPTDTNENKKTTKTK